MKLILIFSSLIIILFSGFYLYEENIIPEWKRYQLDYLEKLKKKSPTDIVKASFLFTTGLRQIWLPEMNRIDRCVSCHVPIEDPFFNNEINPLKTHPRDYLQKHDPEKYGCTVCHDGQGRAVNFKDAVADEKDVFWNKPILRKPFIEANCYRCHIDILEQTPGYNNGKKKFETSGCLGCHKLDTKGGNLGPELRGIGDASTHLKFPDKAFNMEILTQLNHNQNLAYIYEAIRFPKAQPEETVMFDFKLPHEDTRAITVYLKSLLVNKTGVQRLLPKPVYPLQIIEKGKKTFGLYCTACHGKNGMGGVKNLNYLNGYIPRLNTLSEQMFLYKKKKRDAVILILDESGDLLQAGAQPEIPGFFKVVAKYMPVKNIILNGRIAGKKNPQGPVPLNMPVWERVLTEKELLSIIAYLISIY